MRNYLPLTEIVQNCPLCGVNASALFDQREFRGRSVTNNLCMNCGLIYQSPRMTEAERQEFYEDGYRTLYQGQEKPRPEDLAIQEARARVVLDFLPDQVRPTRLLDIGCSSGNLLHHFHRQYQAQVYGVEPGNMYREYALSSGLQVYPSLQELQQNAPGRFDLVSMMHVLEHLPDPLHYIQDLRDHLLEPQGWLLLEVPNLYAHDCFEVAHLTSFSSRTLTTLVREAGFQVVKMRTHGRPRSELIPLYLTLLAQPAQARINQRPLKREAGIKIRRQLGLFLRKIAERLLPGLAWH